ncbi:MAG TPA: sulfatase [Candidatus Polarisedimenticolaceae bacterium]|nr:sulfatase [Candidatus Polarisedimenticolaceae bacterium]
MRARSLGILSTVLVAAVVCLGDRAAQAGPQRLSPNVLIVTIDTLRADHMSGYGYDRATTPNLDRLMTRGMIFDRARTIEPLTGPALVSMITSVHPHEHGASRNGLRMRSGLPSLPKTLKTRGYRTAALVGNWTLRDKLSGLAEHFEAYDEVLTRRRWWGLVRREADAEDLTDAAIEWLEERDRSAPFLLWVHYVEPHAPYRAHDDYRGQLGLAGAGDLSPHDRYDTEIAFVDDSIGRLLAFLDDSRLRGDTMIVFASDHGESLGEHGYWGHGRNLHEPTLRIPMSITWGGVLERQRIDAPAQNIDIAPTVLGLLGVDPPAEFRGFDWTPVVEGRPAPRDRRTLYQAHRGAVLSKHDSDLARRAGLLEVGIIQNEIKELFRVGKNRREIYDLTADPLELQAIDVDGQAPTESLLGWMRSVYDGLTAIEEQPPEPLDEESAEILRSLGYVD